MYAIYLFLGALFPE